MDLPEGRPQKAQSDLSRSLCLRRLLRFRLNGLPRSLLRGELLLDLEGHGVEINSVNLSGGAKGLSTVRLASRRERDHNFDNQLADSAFVGFAHEGGYPALVVTVDSSNHYGRVLRIMAPAKTSQSDPLQIASVEIPGGRGFNIASS